MQGWFLAGSSPSQYEHGIHESETLDGKRVAMLRCTHARRSGASGFGTLMQMIAADEYRGRRVRFSGAVRSEDVDWGGLWMRIDGPTNDTPLAFDNMQQRPIKATTAWSRYEVVLDIAEGAQSIGFGVLLAGQGTIRAADFHFEVVPTDVRPTLPPPLPRHPRNLDLAAD